ncbi:phosphoenolpyruvate carboxylase [Novosphingobium sp. KCTC 2891]|uniref:phosphoenolpyruvate carboxylase n=1 Tax=Novosphingobium sp. KCTC 2891 TaxID=2989730 RepID=UPI0022215866|nr:phosphoenolpyruvate carboxylase [Novosphingobium sp. KCTC 2891]MCW1381472.1 phosphoenolpyruvate carboxylase [Novosphingobium sp. KCTC 2891]
MKTVDALRDRLRKLHERTAETPLFNPVFQLSHDLSRQIESGAMGLDEVESLVAELECEALQSRAARLRRLVAPTDAPDNLARITALLHEEDGFSEFRTRWEKPLLHAVFTAHPTFLLTPVQSDAVATAALADDPLAATVCTVPSAGPPITLDFEHAEVCDAIERAAAARDRINAALLSHARHRWPGRWLDFRPLPFRFASWVGYDMDGRTDIGWHTSISYRLAEKARRLASYGAQLAAIEPGHELVEVLEAAQAHAAEMADVFSVPLDATDALATAANRLTADDPAKLLSLTPLIARLEADAHAAEGDAAIGLATLAGAMRADGLGMGWIHFRVNASQLHNALRRRIDPDGTLDLSSKSAISRLRELLAEVKPLRVNFAALAIETSTAMRQFLAMAQILHHIDADAPIRMLIAECEQPQTVLAALYFARLFGIEGKVDVSPLFETETALEHGGRFLEALLSEESYRAYARQRGRVSIQTGFSDAGRFMGQLPAALAIERLQGRLAEAMKANGLTDVAALIFNTHGESMGRGAHPSGFVDRLTWPLSRWARGRFATAGIAIEAEASFQGGDGYLFFRNDDLALATLTRIAEAEAALAGAGGSDPFYDRTDLSLDFYRSIRRVQREHLESATYARAVTAFGLGLLKVTGSRVSRRQSDIGADRTMSLRQIRAIPHNAILQQIGYPVNVVAGAGSAAGDEMEAIAELLGHSARGSQLVRLLRAANGLASIKTVAAHGELFNSAYWASRPYRGTETGLETGCLALAEYLTKDDRAGVFRRLVSRLRVDWMKLHRLLALTAGGSTERDPVVDAERRNIGLLQSVRLALLMHMFLRAVQVPPFARSNDVSRDDVLEMVLSLRVEDALAQLRRAYPVVEPGIADFAVNEPTDFPDHRGEDYGAIRARFIDPIERAHALNLRIAVAIANYFGAHG